MPTRAIPPFATVEGDTEIGDMRVSRSSLSELAVRIRVKGKMLFAAGCQSSVSIWFCASEHAPARTGATLMKRKNVAPNRFVKYVKLMLQIVKHIHTLCMVVGSP